MSPVMDQLLEFGKSFPEHLFPGVVNFKAKRLPQRSIVAQVKLRVEKCICREVIAVVWTLLEMACVSYPSNWSVGSKTLPAKLMPALGAL